MSMKTPAHEPQSQLAANLVSGPKDVGEQMGAGYNSNLVSGMKPTEESVKGMPGNVLVGGGTSTAKQPG